MENNVLGNIMLLAQNPEFGTDKLNGLMDRGCEVLEYIRGASLTMSESIRRTVSIPQFFVLLFRGGLEKHKVISRRVKAISKVLEVDSTLVTGDLTSFIKSDINYSYFVSDLQYDASVSLDKMASLELIWGDAHLEKLHDFSYLSSLRCVIGNLYATTAENVEGLRGLGVVTGDVHLEQFDMEQISFFFFFHISGRIYAKDGDFEAQPSLQKVKK